MRTSDFLLEIEETITVSQRMEITPESFAYVHTYEEQMPKPYTAFSSSNRCYSHRTSSLSHRIIFSDLTTRGAIFRVPL